MSLSSDIRPFTLQERVVHQLVVRSFIEDPIGLLQGKMGISVAFFHYARFTQKPVYEEIAESLLDDVWNDIGATSSLAFSDGLTGIGWGVEYLIQHGFVSGDSNEVCAELDSRIVCHQHEEDVCGNRNGVEGNKLDVKQYELSGSDALLSEDIKRYALARGKSTNMDIFSFIPSSIQFSAEELPQTPLGLRDGLAGWLLLQMKAEALLSFQKPTV